MSTILKGEDNFSTGETALDWVGVDYDDPDAIGANPVAKIYPDGTIVGSTDNGDYVKYPNGELECSTTKTSVVTSVVGINVYYNAIWVIMFPTSFIETPEIGTKVSTTSGVIIGASTFSESITSSRAWVSGDTLTSSGDVIITAKGKWK